MDAPGFDSLILFVADLQASRAFYVDVLGLPVVYEDDITAVVGGPMGRVVLHATTVATTRGVLSPPGTAWAEPSCASLSRTPTSRSSRGGQKGSAGSLARPGRHVGRLRRPRRSGRPLHCTGQNEPPLGASCPLAGSG